MIKIPNDVRSPARYMIISERINKIILKNLIFSLYLLDSIKIQNKTSGNNLDKKLPTIISSPKKLESLFLLGEINPIIF